MNKYLMRRAIWLGALIVPVGWVSWALAAKPTSVPHPCEVTVADRPGDSITGDPGVVYTDGVNAEARLWDMGNGVADHLYFVAALKLSIPGVTDSAPGGVQTCDQAIFQPNVNSSRYQFYNLLPVGSSTADAGQNFGGLFQCRFGPGNRDNYNLTYESQCIVITHGQYGNTASNPLEWTLTADAGCQATVNKVDNRKLVATWINQDVPFQLTATELP